LFAIAIAWMQKEGAGPTVELGSGELPAGGEGGPTVDEELYRLLSDASFEAVAVHDRGTVLAANSAFAGMHGYETAEVVGMNALDFVAPEARDALKSYLASRQEETFRMLARRKDGSHFPVEVRAKAVSYGHRRVQVASLRDLTDQIEVEKALEELEVRIIRLIEGLPEAVLMIDADGRPRFANPLAEELRGRGIKGLGPEVRAGSFSEPFHLYVVGTDTLYPAERSPILRALEGEMATANDVEIRRPDGTIPLEISAAPIMDESGAVAYAVVVVRDITERKEAEAALKQAEEKYRDIFENAVDGMFQTTPEGRFLEVNTSMARTWGYDSPEEMIADIEDVTQRYVPPERRQEFMRLMEEKGMVQGFEARMTRKDGSTMWTSVSARAVRHEDGSVLHYEGTIEDITEQKRAEALLRESEERYRTLVETSPDAITLTDFSLKIITANMRAATMLGFGSVESIEGTSVLDTVSPEDKVRAFEEVSGVVQSNRALSTEFALMRKDGSTFPAEVSISTVRDAEGRPVAFITIFRDITRRRQSDEALLKINAELQGFAHTVSHDLKNPLSAILLAGETLELLIKAPDTPENRGYIDEITRTLKDSARRATTLIQDLLALAEAGEAPKETSKVDVAGVLRTILDERSSEIAARGIVVALGRDLGRITASPVHVYQVFSNLVGNAIVHNDSKHPEIEVSRLADDASGARRYRVRDNGSGIPESAMAGIFLPFSKGANGQTGIGLAIVEKIVKTYHGDAKAYNDNGAVFEVTFRDL
jgi:PAS domain S-box-containing protein